MRRVFAKLFPEDVQLDFTIAICTYNGGDRIPDVLERLCWQLNADDLLWEVIVIDNNSTDHTAAVVERYQRQWPLPVPLRYAFEPRQGASYARHRAVRLARSPLIGFLDDDNLPSMTWVSAAHRFAQNYPRAGVYGSRIRGDFEINPPENFDRIAQFLALTERGNDPLLYRPEKKVLPPGAGMVVRRDLWLAHVPPAPTLIGRIDNSMVGGEDLEAVLHIQQAGWEVWYNPTMRLYHKIPDRRLKRDYLKSLMRGIGLSRQRTRMLSLLPWQRPLLFWAYHGHDLYRVLRHLVQYRAAVWQDTVAACELTLYVYSFLSPYYFWGRQALQWLAQWRKAREAMPSEAEA